MKNYGRMHRSETMYCMLLPYKDSMKEDVPAKIHLMLAVNKWINPWHALQELSKEIPFKRRQKIEGKRYMKCWWCRRERKCIECRLKYARGFVPLCKNCEKGFKDKITEVKA